VPRDDATALPWALPPVTFGPPDETTTLDVIISRSGLVESRHRVHAAVVGSNGQLLLAARDPHAVTWWRSCAKPFQVMPFVANGGMASLGWGIDELALACASHGGEPEHVALAAAMLDRLGLDEQALACGAHTPLADRGAHVLRASGQAARRIHNNCSGKHAAMLARSHVESWSTDGYHLPTHPVQQIALQSVAAWTGLPASALAVGVDGCAVPVFGLPLSHMALSYARLVHDAARGDDAPSRVVEAMTRRAFLVGGTGRFDTLVMDACGGRVVCKIGAEGVHTLGLVSSGVGIALKVEDGSMRAQYAAVLAVLERLGALPTPVPNDLLALARPPIVNTRRAVVGSTLIGPAALGQPLAGETQMDVTTARPDDE
jgi:L-asparaginase II